MCFGRTERGGGFDTHGAYAGEELKVAVALNSIRKAKEMREGGFALHRRGANVIYRGMGEKKTNFVL